MAEENHSKIISLGSIAKLEDAQGYQTWQSEMKDQLILMDLWTYVEEPDTPEDATPAETKTYKNGHNKAVAAMRNRMGYNGRDLIKDHNNAKKAWDEIKTSFSSKGSGILNGLLTKLWSISLATSKDTFDYVHKFKRAVQEINGMSVKVTINPNLLVLLFHLGLGSEFEIYREHYAQTHEIVNEQDLGPTHDLNYAVTRFLNTCANRTSTVAEPTPVISMASAKSPTTPLMQTGAQPGTPHVATMLVKHCNHCNKNFHTEAECHVKYPHLKQKRSREETHNNTDNSDSKGSGGRQSKRSRDSANGGKKNVRTENPTGHEVFVAYNAFSDLHRTVWSLDSACSQHTIRDRSAFVNYTHFSIPQPVDGLAGTVKAVGGGTIRISCNVNGQQQDISFTDALYVPNSPLNLVSFGQLDGRCPMTLVPGGFTVGTHGIMATKQSNNLYTFDLWEPTLGYHSTTSTSSVLVNSPVEDNSTSISNLTLPSTQDTLDVWHARLGHLGEQNVRKLATMSHGMDLAKPVSDRNPCDPCALTKMRTEPHKDKVEPGRHPMDLIWSDLVGPLAPNNGQKYFVTFLCDYTRRSGLYILRSKDAAFEAFKHFHRHNEHGDNRIHRLRTDYGGEYVMTEFDNYRFEHGIDWEPTVPGNPQQNGAAERLGQTLMLTTNAILCDAGLNEKWWTEVVKTANYLRNRSPVSNRKITPYEANSGSKPSLSHLRRIGTIGYAMERKPATGWKKLTPRSFKAMLVGYEGDHIYRMLLPDGKIYRASSVRWMSEKRSNTVLEAPITEPLSKRQQITLAQDSTSNHVPVHSPSSDTILWESTTASTPLLPVRQPTPQSSRSSLTPLTPSTPESFSTPEITPPPRQMVTRSQNAQHSIVNLIAHAAAKDPEGLIAMASLTLAASTESYEPKTLAEAKQDIAWAKWEYGMVDENESLNTNRVWDLVDLPTDRKALRGRWVYKIKRGGQGEILRYKARWVVRGFEQQEGLDYHETFASVVKPMSYKALFALAAANDWDIDQMDVKTAFLYGEIDEHIYVQQPSHFDDGSGRVCKLNRALYGLKQSPRVWFETLASFLGTLGYTPLDSDFNVFTKDGTLVAIYVDDLLLTGPPNGNIPKLKAALSKRFQMSDLGPCTYYLGMVISRDRPNRALSLDQSAYVRKVLENHAMTDSKPMNTPMDANSVLTKAPDGYDAPTDMRQKYQSAVGSLMYIMLGTRPDIAYAISVVSRYGSNPTNAHWTAVKRIFRYLKATASMRLTYKGSIERLTGYTDSDWAGDHDTRRSTSGFVFTLGSGPISWQSKRQPTVALSTCEAEYAGQTQAAKEAIWLRGLLSQLTGTEQFLRSVIIYGDNQGAIALAKNPQFHARSKHIDIQTHFVRETVANKQVSLEYIPTADQIADGLTKPLTRDKFEAFRKALCIA